VQAAGTVSKQTRLRGSCFSVAEDTTIAESQCPYQVLIISSEPPESWSGRLLSFPPLARRFPFDRLSCCPIFPWFVHVSLGSSVFKFDAASRQPAPPSLIRNHTEARHMAYVFFRRHVIILPLLSQAHIDKARHSGLRDSCLGFMSTNMSGADFCSLQRYYRCTDCLFHLPVTNDFY